MVAARAEFERMTETELDGRPASKDPIPKSDILMEMEKALHEDPDKLEIMPFKLLKDDSGHFIRDIEGNLQIDINSIPSDIAQVGLQNGSDPTVWYSGTEASAPLKFMAQNVPYFNELSRYHDQWAAVARMDPSTGEVQFTILPAMGLIVAGAPEGATNITTNTVIESSDNKEGQSSSSGSSDGRYNLRLQEKGRFIL
jgi:hypothetical protein